MFKMFCMPYTHSTCMRVYILIYMHASEICTQISAIMQSLAACMCKHRIHVCTLCNVHAAFE